MIEDGEGQASAISDRLFEADSIDELLAEREDAVGLRDLVGHHLTIHGVTARRSSMPDSLGAFAVVDVTDHKTGQRMVATTGAEGVMKALVQAKRKEWYPFDCTPFEIQSKSNPGNTVLYLGKAETAF
ncbi:MAG: hypothetical protein ACRDUW_05070 [Pseudonocardiaceae bacterium]